MLVFPETERQMIQIIYSLQGLPITVRAEGDLVPEGLSVTNCKSNHEHYKFRRGDRIATIKRCLDKWNWEGFEIIQK